MTRLSVIMKLTAHGRKLGPRQRIFLRILKPGERAAYWLAFALAPGELQIGSAVE